MTIKILLYALLGGSLALPALGDPAVADRPTITTEGAKQLIAKAEAKARALGRSVKIAVVYSGGKLVANESIEGSLIAGVEL
jgi:uncharacterized protein GlcG (DUF336 family)